MIAGHALAAVLEAVQDILGLGDLALLVPHGRIDAALRQQPVMGAALDDDALVEHQDLVGADHRRQAMRDDERGAAARYAFERVLYLAFGEGVERRGRLVEHQDRRRLQDGAGDGDALLLAARQLEAALAHLGAVAVRARCR